MPSPDNFEVELKTCFLEEAQGLLEQAEVYLLDGKREDFARILHNLKGSARSVGFEAFAKAVHELETQLGKKAVTQKLIEGRDGLSRRLAELAQDLAPPAEMIRVQRENLDKLVDNLGELGVRFSNKLLRDTQELAFSLTMVPVQPLFQKMRRIVRDVSTELGKQVELVLVGEETTLEKNILDALSDPLMHLIHNAIDHGIAKEGQITLEAFHVRNRVVIECRDNGRGMDAEALRERARKQGLSEAGDAFDLIFVPGFSTAAKVTGISGRGIGMDVVKSAVSTLGGRIEVESHVGRGTCFRLLLPFHLALLNSLLVRVGTETYAVPLSLLEQVIEYEPNAAPKVYDLNGLLGGRPSRPADSASLLVLRDNQGALLVDEVLANREILMKRPGPALQALPWISGTTILNDGKVALVLDVPALVAA